MAIPVAYFDYSVNQSLQVVFAEHCGNIPTSFNWDFGDGGSSTEQNPTYLYAVPGTYTISLTATNIDGSNTFEHTIILQNPTTITVTDSIAADLPEGLSIEPASQALWIQKWQLYLQTLVDPHIPTIDVHNEQSWPSLVNILIGKLVIHDAFTRAAAGSLILMMQGASNSEESSSTSPGSSEKSIETGPTKVEWTEASDSISAFMKAKTGEEGNNIFDTLRLEICRLASRLMIQLPLCGKLPKPVIVPQKATFRTRQSDYLQDYRE